MKKKDREIVELNMESNVMGNIAGLFIDQFQMAVLVMLLIISIGVFGFLTLPKESLPEIVLPAITIQTIYPGASPVDVESLVTDKIENELSDFSDVEDITSESSFGLSFINVSFDDSVDINLKKIELDNKLEDIDFPEEVQEVRSSIFKTTEIPLMNVSISGEYSIFELTDISEDIKTGLEKISGVEEVNVFGGLDREIHIITNKVKMLELGVTSRDIVNAISSLNLGFPIGETDLSGSRYSLRIDEQLNDVKDIENTLVKTKTGDDIFISYVADVVDSNEDINEYNNTYVNDGSNQVFTSVFLEIIRVANSDVIGTSQKIKDYLESQSGRLYPSNIKVNISNDIAEDVERDLNNIEGSALSGLIVVIIVLFLFIGFKESIIVSITIPLTLLGTIGVLNFFGITFNTFAILGLIVALGLLVDNSIIVMENIHRLRELGVNSKKAAKIGTNQVGYPILAASLTTLAAFFPLAILPGILGDFVSTIPIVIMITITISLIVSITITPTISSRILSDKEKKDLPKKLSVKIFSIIIVGLLSYYAFSDSADSFLLKALPVIFFTLLMTIKQFSKKEAGQQSKLMILYGKMIEGILRKPLKKYLVLLVGILVFFSSFGLFATGLLKVAFFPTNEPNGLSMEIDTPGGTTLEDTSNIVAEVEEELMKMEEIKIFNTTIGGNEIDNAVVNIEFLDRSLLSRSGFEITDEIEDKMKNIAGAQIIVRGIASGGPPIGKPISIKLTGEDLEASNELANRYGEILNKIGGVYNVEISTKRGVPQIYVDIKENKAKQLGLSVNSIATQLRDQIEGITATTIRDGKKEIDVVVKNPEDKFNEIDRIKNIYLSTQNGNEIPLISVANLIEEDGISSIRQEDTERTIIVDADLKQGFNVNDVINEFESMSMKYDIPNGIEVSYGGDVEGIQDNFINLFQSMILAVFLVFIILTLQFKSIAQPFAILTTVPMALVGVLYGLAITGNDFGFYSFMGLVALVGIAVNDAIVLIDYMNYLRSEGSELIDAIIEAGITRFNPVLATTMTTISGVLPLAFKEVYYAQFSFSLIFGLLVTTFLTLIFIPIVYSIIEGFKIKKPSESI